MAGSLPDGFKAQCDPGGIPRNSLSGLLNIGNFLQSPAIFRYNT